MIHSTDHLLVRTFQPVICAGRLEDDPYVSEERVRVSLLELELTSTAGGVRVGHAGHDRSEVSEERRDVTGEVSTGSTLHPSAAAGAQGAEAVFDRVQVSHQATAGGLLALACNKTLYSVLCTLYFVPPSTDGRAAGPPNIWVQFWAAGSVMQEERLVTWLGRLEELPYRAGQGQCHHDLGRRGLTCTGGL